MENNLKRSTEIFSSIDFNQNIGLPLIFLIQYTHTDFSLGRLKTIR